MNIFKNKSFDSIISAGVIFSSASTSPDLTIKIPAGERLVVEGQIQNAARITQSSFEDVKANQKTACVVQGGKISANSIEVTNVVIDGQVDVKTLKVEGTLALNKNARLTAETVYYRTLIIEHGAVIAANMKHLDYVEISGGE